MNNTKIDKYGFTDRDIFDIYNDFLEYGTSEFSKTEIEYIKGRYLELIKIIK